MNKILIIILSAVFLIFPSKSEAINIAARIGDQYTEVLGGDRLYFEIEIKYPENPRRKDLRLEYQILENDEIIASEKVLRAVETQVSFLDYIVIPENTTSGMKELRVIITDYEDLHQEVSASFNIARRINQLQIYFFIILGAILTVGVLILWQIRSLRR